jgi:hypothetical protein
VFYQTPYRWAPPLRLKEKFRALELNAGKARLKTGPKKGAPKKEPVPGGRKARKRADYDLARVAQAQYEELVKSWVQRRPKEEVVERSA